MNIRKKPQTIFALGALVFGALVLAYPQAAAAGFSGGAVLCYQSVLPALFPFFVVSGLLAVAPPTVLLRPLQKLLRLDSAQTAQAVLLSWVGGYAVCAHLTGQLYTTQRISRRDAALLQILGCCSGPGFVIGCVGGQLLGNVQLGVLLYGMQLAANLLAASVCALFLPHGIPQVGRPETPVSQSLPQVIRAAVDSSLSVCGCVIFFRILGAVLLALFPFSPVFVSAALEISAGCADFATLDGATALYGCCACLSLLGFSVWTQLQLFAGSAFRPHLLLCSRILHFAFLQLLTRLCVKFLPGCAPACSTLSARVIPLLRLSPDAAVAGFVFLCAVLYKVRQNVYNN